MSLDFNFSINLINKTRNCEPPRCGTSFFGENRIDKNFSSNLVNFFPKKDWEQFVQDQVTFAYNMPLTYSPFKMYSILKGYDSEFGGKKGVYNSYQFIIEGLKDYGIVTGREINYYPVGALMAHYGRVFYDSFSKFLAVTSTYIYNIIEHGHMPDAGYVIFTKLGFDDYKRMLNCK